MASYASITRETTEPLKALAHRRRFAQAARIVDAKPTDVVLDYGCADGHFFTQLPQIPLSQLVGFDPNPALLAQMAPELKSAIKVYGDRETLVSENTGRFSLIICIEVCEHLTPAALEVLLQSIRELAAPAARIVFGVPIETGTSGFAKSLYRVSKGGRQGATLAKAFKALVGADIERQATDVEWYGHHTGFDDERFARLLGDSGFTIGSRAYLPFPMLRRLLNNEAYYVCRLKEVDAPEKSRHTS